MLICTHTFTHMSLPSACTPLVYGHTITGLHLHAIRALFLVVLRGLKHTTCPLLQTTTMMLCCLRRLRRATTTQTTPSGSTSLLEPRTLWRGCSQWTPGNGWAQPKLWYTRGLTKALGTLLRLRKRLQVWYAYPYWQVEFASCRGFCFSLVPPLSPPYWLTVALPCCTLAFQHNIIRKWRRSVCEENGIGRQQLFCLKSWWSYVGACTWQQIFCWFINASI